MICKIQVTINAHTGIFSFSGNKSDLYDRTNPDWAPSLKLGPQKEESQSATLSSKKRYERTRTRDEQKTKFRTAQALLDLQSPQNEISDEEAAETGATSNSHVKFVLQGCSEPALKEEESALVSMMRAELQCLLTENMKRREKIQQHSFSQESLRNDKDKAKHYTGLNYSILMALFEYLSPHIPETSLSALTKFEKLMLVLIKLRLNLGLQDLSYRFNVSTSCASKTFLDIIHVMYMRMKCFILWPEREELCLSMPMEFRKYFGLKVSIIIDCFEVFIERPSNLLARAETWSNYKHHNTVKFLIGITPQGAVSFLSKGWGGRVTDKHLTENCDLLSKLLPGDIVLADRGFDIQDSVGLHCAEVKIPAFTRGKKQLSPLEIEQTRKIAHTRIHVERVIGLVRNKYTILQSSIPIDYLHCNPDSVPTIDKIATVACALTNLCESVVPFD